ncbi:MAG: hypothetical protein AABX29_07335 [Nanoarchaeota archaeon]
MKDGKKIRAGPGGARDYSTRVHGDINNKKPNKILKEALKIL